MPTVGVIAATAVLAGAFWVGGKIGCGVKKVFTLGHKHCVAKTAPAQPPVKTKK